MDIGVHVSLWTPEWTSPFLDAIDLTADLGATCVEIPLMDPFSLPLAEIGRRLAIRGLRVYCGTGLGKETDIGSDDPAIRERGMRHLGECLKICARLGSPSLGGVLHSPWGMKGRADPGYAARVATSLACLAEEASGLGLDIALECINRYENSFINTVDQGLALLRIIGKENVGLHLDTYHMNIEERGIPEGIARTGKNLKRIHLSENDRGFPGSGNLPWGDIVAAAKKSGYQGPWIVESYINPSYAASADVCVWRNIETDASASLRKSLLYLRGLIEKV
ncbi:MAG: sugar phosphate isomerase/epimerase family protein [Rectinemataceae bacterium]|jgi:D-psicose/D-tagatose/L-ribulose 3-epimerase